MNKPLILLLALTLLTAATTITAKPALSSDETTENSWATKAPMKEARASLGVAVVNGKIYAIGGIIDNNGGFVGTNEEYNPATDTWTTKKSMPTPRASFGIAVYENKIYCTGGKIKIGEDGKLGTTEANEVYDPATDTWETKAPMPTSRSHLTSNFVNGKIYLFAGVGSQYSVGVYDPAADSWTEKTTPPLAAVQYNYASAVIDSQIFIIGGIEGSGSNANLNQIYDVENDSWSSGASSPEGVLYEAAGATNGVRAPQRVYVLGAAAQVGLLDPPFVNQVYDPQNNSWMIGASPPTSRISIGVAVVNDTLYAIGGHTYEPFVALVSPSAVNEQYLPFGYGTIPPVNPTEPEPFPTTIVATSATAAIIGVGLIVYFRKRNRGQPT